MRRYNKAVASALAGALTTVVGAVWVEATPEEIGAIGTLLCTLFVFFAPKNAE